MPPNLPNRQYEVKRQFCLFGSGEAGAIGENCRMGKPNRIKEWRDRRGWSQETLAEKAGISVSYLSRMERGDRNVSLKNLAKIAPALEVPTAELVIGALEVPLVGSVGAGSAMSFFGTADSPDEMVPACPGATESTVAVEVRGTSLGELFDRWLVYYDEVRTPPTSDLIGRLCVVGLPDENVLVKKLRRGHLPDRYSLFSNVEPPIYDVEVVWAARVKHLSPR